MRVLVTGITGFAGSHLAEALLAQGGVTLYGVSRRGQWAAPWQHLAGRVTLCRCDLGDRSAIDAVLREAKPDRIFHLAGYPHPGKSLNEPEAAWSGNLTATRVLYEAITTWGGRPRVVYVSSGMIYGDTDSPDQSFDETCLLRPLTPYAASKAAADLVSYQVARTQGLDIVRARPFNHIGPGQSSQFAVAHFTKQVAAIERGRSHQCSRRATCRHSAT
jgi:GDP-4-dehydro-6-deoxy-D-mannose reductase